MIRVRITVHKFPIITCSRRLTVSIHSNLESFWITFWILIWIFIISSPIFNLHYSFRFWDWVMVFKSFSNCTPFPVLEKIISNSCCSTILKTFTCHYGQNFNPPPSTHIMVFSKKLQTSRHQRLQKRKLNSFCQTYYWFVKIIELRHNTPTDISKHEKKWNRG